MIEIITADITKLEVCAYAFGGIDAQRHLLESEGVVFKNDQVVDLSVSQIILEYF